MIARSFRWPPMQCGKHHWLGLQAVARWLRMPERMNFMELAERVKRQVHT